MSRYSRLLGAAGRHSPTATGGIMFSNAEIADAPSSGTAYTNALALAGGSIGTVDLANQDETNAATAYAKALFYAKTGTGSYQTAVNAGLAQLPSASTPARDGDTETGGVLPVARQLAGWIIAADLVGYRTSPFLSFADDIRTRFIGGHGAWDVVETTSQVTANNWGTHSLAGRAACSAYLGDTADLDEVANIFRRYTGENRAAWTSWVNTNDHDATWVDSNPAAGINGTSVAGKAGAVVEDICRAAGSYPSVDETGLSYSWEALQGSLVTARILRRTGRYGNPFAWGSNALLRAAQFIWGYRNTAPFNSNPYGAYPPRQPESQWVTGAINKIYGVSLSPLGDLSAPGWAVAAGDWIF